MSTRTERLFEIRKIINTNKIHRQEELLSLLVNKGFDTTQATLSRDLRDLKAGKIHDSHFGSIYFIPEEVKPLKDEKVIPLQGIVSLEFSNDIAVLKTLPGFANSVAVRLDEQKIAVLVGTVAGNDSIIMVFKEGVDRELVLEALKLHFPELIEILV
jgi:transcriptional regulator of arginine metabolism